VAIHPIDVIQHKRDGLVLSDAEIQGFIQALVTRDAEHPTPTDAQAAAFLMALRSLEKRVFEGSPTPFFGNQRSG